MARAFFADGLINLSGSLSKSDKYSYFTRNGQTFTRFKGERTAPLSSNEVAAREHFRRAVNWANLVQKSDELLVHYMNMWHESTIKCSTFRGWLIQYYYRHFRSLTNQQSPITNHLP